MEYLPHFLICCTYKTLIEENKKKMDLIAPYLVYDWWLYTVTVPIGMSFLQTKITFLSSCLPITFWRHTFFSSQKLVDILVERNNQYTSTIPQDRIKSRHPSPVPSSRRTIQSVHIAGGDRFDQNLNHLRVTIGGKKWYWWIVTWLLDTALQNSGQLHKKAGGQMSMLVFKRDVVCTMLRQGATMCSSWNSSGVPKTGPIDDLGYDQLSHFIEKSPYIFFNKKLKISSLLCCHCFVQYY